MKKFLQLFQEPLWWIFAAMISFMVILYFVHFKPHQLEKWDPDKAEAQYEGAKHGQWGERIISLEGSLCEIHRIRYRGIYYIANTCGGILIEPNRR